MGRRAAILAIDQGTTNTKVMLVDEAGRIAAQSAVPIGQTYPFPGWVEQDADAIWQSVRKAIERCLADRGDCDPVAVAISNQREAAVAWNAATGRAVSPLIGWQCRRTSDLCDDLRAGGREPAIRRVTGLNIDPLYSASKFSWIIDNIDEARLYAVREALRLGTVDSWLVWNLTGGKVHACDVSNASRTQLFDLSTLAWSEEMLEAFNVPSTALPRVLPSAGVFGTTAAGLGTLPEGLPVAAVAGDSHAALFGHLGFEPGVVKATYGTGSSLMSPLESRVESRHGLTTTIAWQLGDEPPVYALEGNIPVSGAVVEWLGELLGLANPAREIAELAAETERQDGVYIVPAFVGLGAPHWQSDARGVISGLTRGTRAGHLARAAVESIAYQVRDVFRAMAADAGRPLGKLLADGGASANAQLMQFQADLLDVPVEPNDAPSLSAMGVAYMAGITVGMWSSPADLARLERPTRRFEPRISAEERRLLCEGWERALMKTRNDITLA